MTLELAEALPPMGYNAILEALGRESPRLLDGRLSEIDLQAQQPLSSEEEGVDGLYFPISCLLCRLVSLPEGNTVKVSIVGREGMTGTAALFNTSVSAHRTVVQVPGRAMFLPKDETARLLESPDVAPILLRYLLLLVREVSLTAACNRVHKAQQRLARWLLLISDRSGRNDFPLTHESLSAMLGVRRESITLAARELRNVGAIDYRRGTVTVTNRPRLKEQSCSCYLAVSESYARFLMAELQGFVASAAAE